MLRPLATALMTALTVFAFAGVAHAAAPITMRVPILMYHRIQCPVPGQRLAKLFLCPDVLDAQMSFLESQGWHTISADQLAADYASGECPGPKTFVVTVDDGALDGYVNGAPIWQTHGFTASFAMVTGKAGDYLQIPPPPWFTPAKPHFSWDQARDLISRGFDVIDHTVMHTPVRDATTEQLDAEVQAAQDEIEHELGYVPAVFVYPFGSFGTVEQPYLAARFTLALTDPGANHARNGADESVDDPLHSPRIRVDGGWHPTKPARLLKKLTPFAIPC